MLLGHWFMIAGLLSFALMGVLHKFGERFHCNPLHIAVMTMSTACVVSLFAALGQGSSLTTMPVIVAFLAIPFGISAAVALWLFQRGLVYGRIATSWLLINLSASIPTVLSVVVYHESLNPRKLLALLLIVTSLFLLWWDRKYQSTKVVAGELMDLPTERG